MNEVVFTRDAGAEVGRRLKEVLPRDVFVLADGHSQSCCMERLGLERIPEAQRITLAAGEESKSLENAARIWSMLSERKARRNSVLLNVGGGMITDIGGFAASCFKRGIRFLNVPTTLLAQVDASAGGKTGINFGGLKNEVGTFAFPEAVVIDNGFLASLPERQRLSGFAEMLKHALLADEEHLAKVMGADAAQAETEGFLSLIRESVAVKAAIVQQDPREKGLRKALNFGHTVGHAIESAALGRKTEVFHGEAVAYGLIAELFLSVRKTGFDGKRYEAVRTFIRDRYPACPAVGEPEELYERMLHDKKNEREGVNFTLLRRPGEIETDRYCGREEILEALQQI